MDWISNRVLIPDVGQLGDERVQYHHRRREDLVHHLTADRTVAGHRFAVHSNIHSFQKEVRIVLVDDFAGFGECNHPANVAHGP